MFIRVIALTLFIPGAQTLKDKRQVLQSLISKVRNKFNVSIAEVDHQDQWQRAGLGIAFVSNQRSHLDSVQQEVLDLVETQYPVEVTEISVSEY